ncbi:WHG domain-containing protein [Leucobacter weissii]|uniref:WHG domain-containing protein n=1 Tax=Leucobacter weissii TaxID=1983706 RepID=A0A939MI07_9MICO|nr:TetR/AcrR family transcriptional regulator [Leucobacter weissii]MBO1900390.1 WHG domain-containing protein [Leucobacter weissii]
MSGYHHGDLPRQLLAHAAEMAAEADPESISLRELARRTGVSHSAPVHHFGSRQGLLTALAVEGFAGLHEALSARGDGLSELGVSYVTWALAHPGHYAVMWRPRLLDASDEELDSARRRLWAVLSAAIVEPAPDRGGASAEAYAAFALVHGLAGLWLAGALPRPEEPSELIRQITRRLAGASDRLREQPW